MDTRHQKGQGALEYAFIVVVITVLLVLSMRMFAQTVTNRLETASTNIANLNVT